MKRGKKKQPKFKIKKIVVTLVEEKNSDKH